jgi:hypothetical protein
MPHSNELFFPNTQASERTRELIIVFFPTSVQKTLHPPTPTQKKLLNDVFAPNHPPQTQALLVTRSLKLICRIIGLKESTKIINLGANQRVFVIFFISGANVIKLFATLSYGFS